MIDISEYIAALEEEFRTAANPKRAEKQAAYMRDQFPFFGIMSTERKEILKPFLNKENRPPKTDLSMVVKTLWQKPEREYQYAAQELAAKYLRHSDKRDIDLFEWMITTKSWWDTVDFIASTIVGNYFKHFPDQLPEKNEDWLHSGDIWLQRTTLIFQLKYKEKVDEQLLVDNIRRLNGTNEFFINKAIGWALREYGKVNPEWVSDFTNQNNLSNLSRREALKRLN
jgi:3-methyladenine DNA glycosylase AlkD